MHKHFEVLEIALEPVQSMKALVRQPKRYLTVLLDLLDLPLVLLEGEKPLLHMSVSRCTELLVPPLGSAILSRSVATLSSNTALLKNLLNEVIIVLLHYSMYQRALAMDAALQVHRF